MIELVLDVNDAETLQSALLGHDSERCAVLFASQTKHSDGRVRLLTRQIKVALDIDYARRNAVEAELKPEFVAAVTKQANLENLAIVFVHSHPGETFPQFSAVDDDGESHLSAFLERRHAGFAHCAMVISSAGMRARRIGTRDEVRVISIGKNRTVLFNPQDTVASDNAVFERQIRAFGEDGQRTLNELRIAIVGLGGTGSLVAQQLVHLGVNKFILIDPDVVEITNVNRLANASTRDIGHLKVKVAARYVRQVSGDASINEIHGDITETRIAEYLRDADLIFGCTDSHGSRAILQQVSYQYMIPCVDLGVVIAVNNDQITHIFGRVQLLSPGFACFSCSGLLDSGEVRRDMLSEFQRKADPYLQGVREPAPAVMSLNGTVSSLAVSMMLSITTGMPMPIDARHLIYNGISATLRSVQVRPQPNCYICSRSGALARGDSWAIFGRNV